jgi:hypothetical protein
VLGLGLIAIVALLVLEMSGSGARMADSDHVSAPVFAATVPGGGTACQPIASAANDLSSVRLVIGTYGHPVPALSLRLTDAHGQLLAAGSLAAAPHEGEVVIPVRRLADLSAASQACLHVGGSHNVVLGGEAGPGGSVTVNRKRQPGNISLIYLRQGKQSWWQLLPTLDTRFGLGKAPFFGDWTLPVLALLLAATWVAAIRLILRTAP